jgi:hypothetical protein
MSTYIEIGYVSADWKVFRSKKLQDLCVRTVEELLEMGPSFRGNSCYWITDKVTNHKDLLVNKSCSSKLKDEEYVEWLCNYMNGFLDAVGYM